MKVDIRLLPVFRPLVKPARHKGAHGGRGSGKSHFFADYLLIRCLENPGFRAVCVREVQNTIKESVKRLLEDKIKQHGLGPLFNVQKTEIETPGGGLIIFKGMQHYTAESIKSLEGYDVAWVEEAQTVSQKSLDLLTPTIRKDGSELWYSWNPRKKTDPVDAMLRTEPRRDDAIVIEVNWSDNPHFPEVLRSDMEWDRANNPEKYAHVWEGAYQERSEAMVFHNWSVRQFDTPDDARFYFGGDWGFAKDPTTLVRCYIDGRTLYIDHEVYKVGCEIDYLPFLFGGAHDSELRGLNREAFASLPPEAKAWRGIPHARRWPIIADSARPETISHMQRHGFDNVQPAKKGAGSVEEGVEFLRNFQIVIHPRCTHTAAEFGSYCYKVDRITGEILPKLEDANNHCIDAVRYAIESVRRGEWGLLFAGDDDYEQLKQTADEIERELMGK